MTTILNIVQIIISVVLGILILLQARNAGLGRTFGSDAGAVKRTRRGIEQTIYQFTIIMSVAFLLISLANAALAG
jgi:protein translocase SecG subunit